MQINTLDRKHETSAEGWDGEKRRPAIRAVEAGDLSGSHSFLGGTRSILQWMVQCLDLVQFPAGCGIGCTCVAGQASCMVSENLDLSH